MLNDILLNNNVPQELVDTIAVDFLPIYSMTYDEFRHEPTVSNALLYFNKIKKIPNNVELTTCDLIVPLLSKDIITINNTFNEWLYTNRYLLQYYNKNELFQKSIYNSIHEFLKFSREFEKSRDYNNFNYLQWVERNFGNNEHEDENEEQESYSQEEQKEIELFKFNLEWDIEKGSLY